MRLRIASVAMVVMALLAGCGGGPGPEGPEATGEGEFGTGSATVTSSSPGTASSTPTPIVSDAITCNQLRDAAVGAVAFPLADYGATGLIQLSDGRYTGPDGTEIELLPVCAHGDLNGDGAVDAVAGVRIDPDGTGTFYSLVAWLATDASEPALAGSVSLGDRNPIHSITISGGVVTVVYLTRTGDVPMAGLNVRRTATYEFTEPGLGELSHTDESCGPCNP